VKPFVFPDAEPIGSAEWLGIRFGGAHGSVLTIENREDTSKRVSETPCLSTVTENVKSSPLRKS